MIRKLSSAMFFLFICLVTSAQTSVEAIYTKALKSLVRVEVTDIPGKDDNVCTGFVWKDPKHIVTSLHAMSTSPSAKIWILYLNEFSRQAKVIRVYKEADLVLLEILPGKDGKYSVPDGVVPLNAVSLDKPGAGSNIYALGFNHGAPKSSSRKLEKGFTEPPETLRSLVPPDDAATLGTIGFPTLDLDILYLEGSLLPGYSGSPAFDAGGKLIGIGDGGLKKGQSSVSWVIPAKYLSALENSSVKTLPAGLASSDKHFTSSVPKRTTTENNSAAGQNVNSNEVAEVQKGVNDEVADSASDQPDEDGEEYYRELYSAYESSYDDDYLPVVSNNFEFWMTQNSSLVEIAETSDDPQHLYSFANELNNTNVKLDYANLRFDIYEDINYGVIIAVPEGDEVFYDQENDMFQVNYDENPDVDLYFTGVAGDFSNRDFNDELSEMFDWVPPMMAEFWDVESFTINEQFSSVMDVDENRKIAYILMHSEKVEDENGNFSNFNLYITVLMSKEKSFMAVASYNMLDENFRIAREQGVDCINFSNNSEYCDYFESIYKVFCASHLTTFAY